jgi:2-haloacid dehalogenase
MPSRPKVVAFDIIETTFSLELVRGRLVGLGLPASALELWFATGLRDAFALGCSGGFAPFKSVLEGALDGVLFLHGLDACAEAKQHVLAGMRELSPQPDAREAFETLKDAGIRIIALSNGAAASTQALLEGAGLDGFVERIVSVDDVRRSKPRPEVYLHAAGEAGVAPGEVALVATHAWDVHGAKSAGLMGAFVARGQPYPAVMTPPDVTGETLGDVARALAAL